MLVIAGSREIPGAAILAASVALRAGAGKLTIATVQSVAPGMALVMPEARVIALPETPAGGLTSGRAELLKDCAEGSSAVLIGPGLLNGPGSRKFELAPLRQLKGITVIPDALAMDVLLRNPRFDGPMLVTPHAGEMAHLTGQSKDDILAEPAAAVRDLAHSSQAVAALKGATTLIVSPQGGEWRHVSSTPVLGTSGSGDVQAGIMTGLAARGASLEQAAAAWGVVLHAQTDARPAERNGRLGFLARELLPEIPLVMHEI